MSDPIARLNAALEGRYHVEREIGEGGMATVYLADDLKHERKVALKVLKAELAAVVGADRFLAEIKTTANLQHPHILPLYDSGEADGFLYYVMPYIEGETLADRLEREKQLPVDEAVSIATDVAEALHAAHEQGVIHRDVKPANILLSSGRPIVADFGIALAVTAAGGGRLTETGLSMGTPFYMSPEQATADRELDARSDLYSLACVTYEMLTGDPPHTGSTAQAVMASVLTEDPRRITSRRSTVPPHVEAAVHKALAKLPADRYSSAADYAKALEDRTQTLAFERASPAPSARGIGALIPWGIAAALAVGLGWSFLSRPSAETLPLAASILLEEGARATGDLALSPDETQLVYSAARVGEDARLWVRDLGDGSTRPLPDTEGAFQPFWSPEGTRIAYFARGQLFVVQADGGAPFPLADAPQGGGGAWNADDVILFSPLGGPLFQMRASPGSTPIQVTQPVPSSTGQRDPVFLPDGRQFLFWVWNGREQNIYLGDLDSGETKLLGNGNNPSYVEGGWLVFSSGGAFAQRFDAVSGRLEGQPQSLVDDVRGGAGGANLTVQGQTLVYQPEQARAYTRPFWRTRDGEAMDSLSLEHGWKWRLSNGGTRLGSAGTVLWVHDLTRDITDRFDTQAYPIYYAWSPDDGRIVYSSNDTRSLRIVDVTGTALEEVVYEPDTGLMMGLDWSPDGGTVLFVRLRGEGRAYDELWALELDSGTASQVPTGPYNVLGVEFSPNGEWIAVVTDETGPFEVYLRPFPGPGRAVRVSRGGGAWPLWRGDGRELFYVTQEGRIAAVQIDFSGAVPAPAVPEILPGEPVTTVPFLPVGFTPFVVSLDGERFLVDPDRDREVEVPFNVIRGWQAGLDEELTPP